FVFSFHRAPRSLHSFPTRRSSDLGSIAPFQTLANVDQAHAVAAIDRGLAVKRVFDNQKESAVLKLRNESKTRLTASPRSIAATRSEEHTSELQSRGHLVCRLLLEK